MTDIEYTLKALAEKLDPATFKEWQSVKDDAERAKSDAVSAMLRGNYTSSREAPAPAGIRIVRRGKSAVSVSALSKLQSYVKDAIASSKYKAWGTQPDGRRQPIPRAAADADLDADLTANTLRTGAGYVWRNVKVKRLGKSTAELTPTPIMVKWYRDRGTSWVGRPPSGPDDERDFKKRFPMQGGARGLARELRRLYAPPDWHNDGPKVPKSKARKARAA
jgi:hypothetical protein